MANDGGNVVPRIAKAEHIGPKDTGDNIEAKRVALYGSDPGLQWQRLQLTAEGLLKTDATFSGTVESSPTFSENPTDPTPTPAYGKVDGTGIVQTNGTAQIQDSNGNDILLGQNVESASVPVVIASDQPAIDVDTGITGYATASNQTDKSQFTKLTDGTDTALVTASGEQNVIATAQPGVDIGDVTVNNAQGHGTAAAALRVELPTDGTGQVNANQGGTWNLNNVAGVISLPSGASTSALQTAGNTTLTNIEAFIAAPSTMVAFRTTVTLAGTRVQLATNTVVAGVLEADPDNTPDTYIYVGGSNVSGTVWGAKLLPGASTGIAINNTDKIWIDASSNGNKLGFMGS